MMKMAPWIAFFLVLFCYSPVVEPLDYPTANLSTTWTNEDSAPNSVNFQDGSVVIPILFGPKFDCGFICYGTCISYYFGIFFVDVANGVDFGFVSPQVVWLANRDDPVGLGATLNFSAAGELILKDFDGNTAWTTGTTGKSVVGMNLTDTGNLVLFGIRGLVVWQSFDHPTDCLLPGQNLVPGQKLIASVSSTNWTTQQSLYSITVAREGLFAYFESQPLPYAYYNSSKSFFPMNNYTEISYVRFFNGSLSLFYLGDQSNTPYHLFNIPLASATDQYVKLMSDGHLKVFERNISWTVVDDLLTYSAERCDQYPLSCGRNALCSSNQQCSCPGSSYPVTDYYRPVNGDDPSLGCYETNPLTCNATQDQEFIELQNYKHFTFMADMKAVNAEACKQACRENCSCKAAIFQYDIFATRNLFGDAGLCYFPSGLYTLTETFNISSSVFIKVQKVSQSPLLKSQRSSVKVNVAKVIGFTVGCFLVLVIVVVSFIIFKIRKRKMTDEMEEEYLDKVPGMPDRFSYEGLKTATANFSKKLGEGGFGSVYEGILDDGSKIAVKCLEGHAQVKKSFLAEVQSIGSIHHVNLVRLIGFCSWKSQRFLVYEYMSNRSLDRWIYHEDREHVLGWECRKKIILDIAKGLAYLHEDCRQKIIHLDIKPQNILLDNEFNAKVSDFGLSKLIDRNETQVMTTMRGTPGYLAPEWLSSVITEKVDVYSFGIVLLEILCGRKNFDISQPEESQHLLSVFQKSCEQGMLLDMVDKYCDDMQAHDTEVVEVMKVTSWCLQTDYTRRPSMSLVIKVLDGVMNVDSNLDYNFSFASSEKTAARHEKDMTPLSPFSLSGPR